MTLRSGRRFSVQTTRQGQAISNDMSSDDLLHLAASRGLQLREVLRLNEMGLDFEVAFARDLSGQTWVIRIPRREGLDEQVQKEKRILQLVRKHLSISVPDWQIVESDLVAYPLLKDDPIITLDPTTHELHWNIDRENGHLTLSLARILSELHQIPASEASEIGLQRTTIQRVREERLDEVDQVKRKIGLRAALENRWRRWIETDDFWPAFTSFVHGDLYAGHILADRQGNVTGMIDWSEAHLGDPTVDFSGHLAVFGEESLRELILYYEEAGGRVWRTMFDHTRECHAAKALTYASFALRTQMEEHIEEARRLLGVEA